MKTPAHHDKSIVGLLCVVIAFVMFLIFNQNQDFLFDTNSTSNYLILSAIASGLLMVLFFLVSNRTDKAHTKSSSKKSSKRKR